MRKNRFSLSKINKHKLVLLGWISLIVFISIPVDAALSRLSFNLAKISFYTFFALTISVKYKYNTFIKALFFVGAVSTIIMGLPTSYGAFMDSFNYVKSAFLFKIIYSAIFFLPGALLYFISRFRGNVSGIEEQFTFSNEIRTPNAFVKNFTWVFLLFYLIYMIGSVYKLPLIYYVANIFFKTFNWYLLLIGFWNNKLGKSTFIIAILICSLNLLLSFMAGGRFTVIQNFILILVGIFISDNYSLRKIAKKNLYWVIPFAIVIIGLVGIIRNEIGRMTIGDVLKGDRMSVFFDALGNGFQKFLTDSDFRSTIFETTSSRTNGAGALKTVILLSPNPIPYRGVDNLATEFYSIFKIASLQSGGVTDLKKVREERIESGLGTSVANRYGFNVSVTNSVEWPVYADAYSRGGLLVVILYFVLSFFWFKNVDRVARTFVNDKFKFIIIQLVLMKIIFYGFSAKPLAQIIRESILYVIFSIIIMTIVTFLSKFRVR